MARVTKLNVMLTASVKGLSAGISKAQGMLKGLSASARKAQAAMGKAFTTGVFKGLSSAAESVGRVTTVVGGIAVKQFQRIAIGAVAAAGALAYLTKQSIDAVGDQNDFAKSVGLSYNKLRQLQYAAQLAGIDNEKLNASFAKMSDVIGSALDGNQGAIDSLNNIGITIQQLNAMKPEQRFEAIANAINRIQDPAKRLAAARDIFGRSGGALVNIFDGVAESMRDAADVLGTLGLQLSELDINNIDDAGDAMERIKLAAEGVGTQMAGAIAPYITQAMNDTQKWLESMGGIDSIVNGAISRLADALAWILDKTVYIQAAWRELKDIVSSVAFVFDLLPEAIQKFIKAAMKWNPIRDAIVSDIQGHADQINKEGSGAAGFRDRVGAWGRGAQDAAAQSAQERVQSDHDQRKRDRIQREREQQMAGIQAQREGQAPELSPSQQRAAEIIQGAQRRGVMPSGPLQQGRGPRERNYWERNGIPDPRLPEQMNSAPGAMQGPAQNTASEDTNLLRQIAANTGKNTLAYAG